MKKPLEEMAIKEARSFLKTVSEGLKTLAKGVENLARQVDTLADATPDPPERRNGPADGEAAGKPGRPSKAETGPPKRAEKPASDTVLRLILRSRKGLSTAAIAEQTGFDKKKVSNILYRLKKQGKIKTAGKGIYIKA